MTKLSGLENISVDRMVRGLRATARNIEATAVELESCEACKVEPASGPANCHGQDRPLCKKHYTISLKIESVFDNDPRPRYIPYVKRGAKHTIEVCLNDFWIQEGDITPGEQLQ